MQEEVSDNVQVAGVSLVRQAIGGRERVRLERAAGSTAKISLDRATGTASFIRFEPGALRLAVAEGASVRT